MQKPLNINKTQFSCVHIISKVPDESKVRLTKQQNVKNPNKTFFMHN